MVIRLLRDCLKSLVLKNELYPIKLEKPLVLRHDRVFGDSEDLDESMSIESAEGGDDRQSADQLGNDSVLDQIARDNVLHPVALVELLA